MKILLLTNSIVGNEFYLRLKKNLNVEIYIDILRNKDLKKYDLVISYAYKYIIKKEKLLSCKRPPINLHISLLPLNKGSDPNFWAWYNNTDHGVTIHHINNEIDGGDIIYQKKINFKENESLLKSYQILNQKIQELFFLNLDNIINYNYETHPQLGYSKINYHKNLPDFDNEWNNSIETIKSMISTKKIKDEK